MRVSYLKGVMAVIYLVAGISTGVAQPPAVEKKRPASVDSSGYDNTLEAGKELPTRRKLRAQKVPDSFPTEFSGGILQGTYTKEDGPFLIKGSVIVPAGQKLEFGPGCKIYIGGDYSTITIFGQFAARGTEQDPVEFQSSRRFPHPWDWDRIYCRSRNRSVFEHCIIRHSNYGIFVENGSATVNRCTFRNNSLHGIAARNSDVSIYNSTIEQGHILALLLREGSVVRAESLVVRRNVSGIGCENKSSLTLTGGMLAQNSNGVVVAPKSAVNIVGTSISRNKIGIISTEGIHKKLREMAFGNTEDAITVSSDKLENLLKPPEEVKSVVLPKSKTEVTTSEGFVPGFSATKAPREQSVSFMGNVRIGTKYFDPASDIDSLPQTRYPDGIQPEIQVFASGRRKNADINLLMDFYGNHWIQQPLHLRKNTFNLSMNYGDQRLIAGDFYESGSRTSISGRKLTGIRYTGEFIPIGRGSNRVSFKLAAGESERPKDVGENELELYNDTVDTGMSLHQQITYIAGLSTKPTLNSVVNVKGIISRDQVREPLFRDIITDPKAPDPVKGQSGHIDGTLYLLGDDLAVNAEIDLGSHDTLDTTMITEREEVVWYNPQVNEAIPEVLGLRARNLPDHWRNNLAGSIGLSYLFGGYDLQARYTEIRPSYFSAGNPYLESDRRIAEIQAEKQLFEHLNASLGYEYERRDASSIFEPITRVPSPQDNHSIDLESEYAPSEDLPVFGFDYTFAFEQAKKMGGYDSTFKQDTIWDTVAAYSAYQDREIDQRYGVQLKQRLPNGFDYSVRYRLLWENELGMHPDPLDNDLDDGIQHQFSGRVGIRLGKRFRNKTAWRLTTKREARDSLRALSYKFSNQVRFSIVPRKLTVRLAGDYARTIEREHVDTLSAMITTERKNYRLELDLKYSLTSRLSMTGSGKYEDSHDEMFGSPENYDVKVGGLSLTYLF